MRTHKMIVTLSALAAMTAFAGQTIATATPADDIKAARSDLSHGKLNAALDKTAKAETGLLNQQQAGDKSVGNALDNVQRAHHDIMAKDTKAAMNDLDSALNVLGSS